MNKNEIKNNFKWIQTKIYYGKISYYAVYVVDGNYKKIKIDDNQIEKVIQNIIYKGDFYIEEYTDQKKIPKLIFKI